MPGLDKTGPMGQGSKTGRKQGTCRNIGIEENIPIRGMGRRFRNRIDPETEFNRKGGGRGFGKGRN